MEFKRIDLTRRHSESERVQHETFFMVLFSMNCIQCMKHALYIGMSTRKVRMDGECLRRTSSYGWYRKQVADEPRCLLWGNIAHAPPRVPLNHFEYGIEYLRVMYELIDISPYRIIMELPVHHFNARVITRDRPEAKMALPGTWARCS